jgi:hypothetical protein
MWIPKLLKNEVQLYYGENLLCIYVYVDRKNIRIIDLYNDNYKMKDTTIEYIIDVKDMGISINTKFENIISINSKFRNNLLSKDIITINMMIDIIIEEHQDFISQYLKKFE